MEHYRPKSRFPSLAAIYSNLFYACSTCNIFKDDYWNDRPEFHIPNPCDHVMSEHLMFQDHMIEHRSERGSIAIETLRLNNENSTDYRRRLRRDLLDLIDAVARLKVEREFVDIVDRAVVKIAELCGLTEAEVREVCNA